MGRYSIKLLLNCILLVNTTKIICRFVDSGLVLKTLSWMNYNKIYQMYITLHSTENDCTETTLANGK